MEGGVGFFASEVVVDDDVAAAFGVGVEQIAGGTLRILAAHGAEIAVRAYDGLGVRPAEAGEALEDGEGVVEAAYE